MNMINTNKTTYRYNTVKLLKKIKRNQRKSCITFKERKILMLNDLSSETNGSRKKMKWHCKVLKKWGESQPRILYSEKITFKNKDMEIKQKGLISSPLFNNVLRILANVISQGSKINIPRIFEKNYVLFTYSMLMYIKTSKIIRP